MVPQNINEAPFPNETLAKLFLFLSELQDKVNGISDVIQKELGVKVKGGSSSSSGAYKNLIMFPQIYYNQW